MKNIILASMVAFGCSVMADIPTPTVDKLTVSGDEAAELAKSLPGDYKTVSEQSGPMFRLKQKVLRTKEGKTQIVCKRLEFVGGNWDGQVKSENCEMQKSGNGVELDR